jgi:hypothetical protein
MLPRQQRLAVALALCVVLTMLSARFAASASGAKYPGSPDPGGSELAKVSVPPPPGKSFGFIVNTPISDSLQMTPSLFAHLSKEAGANVARVTLDWRYMESNQGQWDTGSWSLYQDIYTTWRAAGITPMFTLCCAPVWARESKPLLSDPQLCTKESCVYPPARSMDWAWARFTAEIARRFPKAIIQIWNEPNLPQFWRSGPNPQRYAELASIAYHSIKQVSPSTIVLAGDLAPSQTSSAGEGSGRKPGIPLRDFLDATYTATPSIKHSMDALAIHTLSQDTRYGPGTFLAKVLGDVRTVEAKHHDKKRHLWMTEAGLSTTGPAGLSQRVQADGLLRQYRRFMTMPDVDGVVFNSLTEMPSVPWTNTNRGYGVVRFENPTFPPKLAFCAFADRANLTPPSGCRALWEPKVPGLSKHLRERAHADCRSWFRPSRMWQAADHARRKAIISACVQRYLDLRLARQLKALKSSSHQQCREDTPLASHWRHHGHARRQAAVRNCTYRRIRSGLDLDLSG